MNDDHNPYLQLWKAALKNYLEDALAYHELITNNKPISHRHRPHEQAYNDIKGNCRILVRLCDRTGHDPDYLRELFTKVIKGQIRDKL